jgi:hypothetical protein
VRRLFWLLVGIVLGMGVTVWLLRALRIRVLESTPAGVAIEVGGSVRRLGADLRDAVDEGRLAMQEREVELRLRLDGAPAGVPELLSADAAPEVLPLRHRSRVRARR